MKCSVCGKECHEERYPEIVFKSGHTVVCEECSIDWESDGEFLHIRTDLIGWMAEELATVYFWNNDQWNKLATYTTETAMQVIQDASVYQTLGVSEMRVVGKTTGGIYASNII